MTGIQFLPEKLVISHKAIHLKYIKPRWIVLHFHFKAKISAKHEQLLQLLFLITLIIERINISNSNLS